MRLASFFFAPQQEGQCASKIVRAWLYRELAIVARRPFFPFLDHKFPMAGCAQTMLRSSIL
jgi:hypothetical protein